MATGFHAAILATAFAATVAVGFASASIYMQDDAAPKADRLPVAVSDNTNYLTVGTPGDGITTLSKVKVD